MYDHLPFGAYPRHQVILSCDINQLWEVNQAIDIGRRVEPYHLFWLEEVVAHDDYQGLARVADALTTPICADEYHYGIRPFRHMLEARSMECLPVSHMAVDQRHRCNARTDHRGRWEGCRAFVPRPSLLLVTEREPDLSLEQRIDQQPNNRNHSCRTQGFWPQQ